MNIAVLGATSHIAKGLIEQFLAAGNFHLYLFTRDKNRLRQFLFYIGKGNNEKYNICEGYDSFERLAYDAIINCIGVEARNKSNCDFKSYFNITEKFDNMAIAYLLEINPQALYISFSSGAVYGKGFSEPAGEFSMNYLDVNHIVQEDYYGIARINAETKHRANRELRIIDLRVFSYFSRFINLSDGFFITDVIQAVLKKKVLITDGTNIVRDYIHPKDLFTLVLKCIDAGYLNIAFDVTSKMPVSKQDILDFFSSEYSLEYEVRNSLLNASATGQKNNYFSRYYNTATIGYEPQYASIDTIKEQVRLIL